MSLLEEKLREASAVGDAEAISSLIAQNIDINSKNPMNGWTALHWACKRNNENIVRALLNVGADPKIENNKGDKPANVCSNPNILSLLGEPKNSVINNSSEEPKFVPNYIRNAPINGQLPDHGMILRQKPTGYSSLPSTALPSQPDDLVLLVRIAGTNDPDYIEIEVPRWKLTYKALGKICCEELEVNESQVERIRKLPNVRLRKDSDVKRLTDFQCLEIVLKTPLNNEKYSNTYQSISTHKDQTILY